MIATSRPSRNAPCPCGSGRKYKVCCLNAGVDTSKLCTGQDAVIVCMPTRGQITWETYLALSHNMKGIQASIAIVGRLPVIQARNRLAQIALDHRQNNPFPFTPREWYVFWLDDDAWFLPGGVATFLSAMREYRHFDAIFGKFGVRSPFCHPFAYKSESGESYPRENEDCGPTELVEITRAGFHRDSPYGAP